MTPWSCLGNCHNSHPDGDGLANLQEYQGGTDPNDYYNDISLSNTPVRFTAGRGAQLSTNSSGPSAPAVTAPGAKLDK
jgi:hypothetical protein